MIINQWYAIMPSNHLKRNKIAAVRRMNEDLVIFRYASGVLGCVADKCTHRGAALSQGRLNVDCLQCPFHGLEFDTAGKCRFVPADGIASKEDLSRFNVKHYPVREVHDIIYLWYGDDDKVTDDIPFFDAFADDGLVYSEFEDNWNAHYSRCIENHLDVMHLPYVHRTTIGRMNKTLVNGPRVEYDGRTMRMSEYNEIDIGQTPRKAEELTVSEKSYLAFQFPNVWMNRLSDRTAYMAYFSPVDDQNTVMHVRVYGKATGIRAVDRVFAWFARQRIRRIENQDKRVVETQKPKVSSLRSSENLLAGDAPIVTYRRIRDELKSK